MAEPMIKLDPNGTAPILDYGLPDSTSYAGRHYLVLDLPAEVFVADVQVGLGTGGQDDAPPSGKRLLDLIPHSPELLGVEEGDGGRLILHCRVPVDDRLSRMTSGQLRGLLDAGADPVIARAMDGSLTLRKGVTTTYQGDKTSSGIVTADPKVLLVITSPGEGAVIAGPTGGVDVVVTGRAEVILGEGQITRVETSVNGGGWQAATQADGRSWDNWTATVQLKTPGRHRVAVQGVVARSGKPDVTWQDSRTVVADLAVSSTSDTQPPTLVILDPQDGAQIMTPDRSAKLQLRGTASDDTGVQKVSVARQDRDGVSTVDARIDTTSTPSTWVVDVDLTVPGRQTLTVTASDAAGNQHSEAVTVELVTNARGTLKRCYLTLIESYRLSSFLGRYGAGRSIKTFSLLPDERTKIYVKTWTQTEERRKEASSILESAEVTAAEEFSRALETENTAKQSAQDRFDWEVNSSVEQGWGTGKASVKGGMSGGCNAAREEFGKTVTGVTAKHSAQASSKREIHIDAEYEQTQKSGVETSIERELHNVNVGRTLNFVFRQMNQEFISILHLVDVRIGFVRVYEHRTELEEARITELESLLERVVVQNRRLDVREAILEALRNVTDHQDVVHDVTETVTPKDNTGAPVPSAAYRRIRRDAQSYTPTGGGAQITVPGVIIAVTENILRTEGVIVDAVLGQGEALDEYSRGTQKAAVKDRELRNALMEVEIDERRQVIALVDKPDEPGAKIYRLVHPAPEPSVHVTFSGSDNGKDKS